MHQTEDIIPYGEFNTKALSSFDLEGIAEKIRSGEAVKIVTMVRDQAL
jgi:hypothetical protein